MPQSKDIKAARLLLGWEAVKAAEHAGVSPSQIIEAENGLRGVPARIVEQISRALESEGISFTAEGPCLSADDNKVDLARITPRQLRAARALIGQERIEVARRLAMTRETIRKAESDASARPALIVRLRAYFEAAGVEFMGDDAGVRLRSGKEAA